MISFESVYRNRKHILTLYKLLEERTPEQSISHKEMPSLEDHSKFYYSKPYFIWNVIKNEENQIVGTLYLTHQREIGIFIFNEFKGKGYAEEAIRLMKSITPGRFLANVNPQNEASNNLFQKLGGKLIQQTYEL